MKNTTTQFKINRSTYNISAYIEALLETESQQSQCGDAQEGREGDDEEVLAAQQNAQHVAGVGQRHIAV